MRSSTRGTFERDIQARDPNATFTVTGHSLGGGLAQLVSAQFDLGGVTVDALGAARLTGLSELNSAGFTFPFAGTTALDNYLVTRSVVPGLSSSYIGRTNPIDIEGQVSIIPILLGFAANPLAGLALLFGQVGRDLIASHSSANIYAYFQSQTRAGQALTEVMKEFVERSVQGYRGDGKGVSQFLSEIFGIVPPITQEKAEEGIAKFEALKASPEFSDPGNRSALDDLVLGQDQLKIATQDILSIDPSTNHWSEKLGDQNLLVLTVRLQHRVELTEQLVRITPSDLAAVGRDYVLANASAQTRTVIDSDGTQREVTDYFVRASPGRDSIQLGLIALPDADSADNRTAVGNLKFSLPGRDETASTVMTVPLGIYEDDAPISDPQTTRTIVGDVAPNDLDPGPGVSYERDELGNLVGIGPDPGRADTLYDSAESDLVQAGGGGDTIDAFRGGADTIQAGSGRDRVHAAAGTDVVEAGAGADIVAGGAGDDQLYAEAKVSTFDAVAQGNVEGSADRGDWLAGGEGEDVLIGGSARDVLSGGAGRDLLIGGGGEDNLLGDSDYLATSFEWTYTDSLTNRLFTPVVGERDPAAAAEDTIYGGGGPDWIWGGAGSDYIAGEDGDDVILGEAGDDVIAGGSGDDSITGDARYIAAAFHGRDFIDAGAGDDQVEGSGGEDTLLGGAGADALVGDAYDTTSEPHQADYLDGGAGQDFLDGSGGNDTLLGGEDNDILGGGDGADILDGGSGDDFIAGEVGDDVLTGGAGADTFAYNVGSGSDTITDLSSEDILYFNDTVDPTVLEVVDDAAATGVEGASVPITLQYGGAGDQLVLDPGVATVSFARTGESMRGEALSVFLAGVPRDLGGSEGADVLIGNRGADTLSGLGGEDRLEGREGPDALLGGAGADSLMGGLDADTLDGGDGADLLDGGQGDDQLRGGLGDDVYRFLPGDGRDSLTDAAGSNNLLFGSGIASFDLGAAWRTNADGTRTLELHVGKFGDKVELSEASVAALGSVQLADGTVVGGQMFLSGALANRFVLDGTSGPDVIAGTPLDDLLNGIAGADALHGGAGADTLDGGGGDDLLAGEAGSDTYLLAPAGGDDLIQDTSADAETVRLTGGLRLADFSVARNGNDLVLAAAVAQTGVVIKDFFNPTQAGKAWMIAGEQDSATALRVWAEARLVDQAQAAVEQQIELTRNTFLAALAADLQARGRFGDSLGSGVTYSPAEDLRYQFAGVARTAFTTNAPALVLPSSESTTSSTSQESRNAIVGTTRYEPIVTGQSSTPIFAGAAASFGWVEDEGLVRVTFDSHGRPRIQRGDVAWNIATGTDFLNVVRTVDIQNVGRGFVLQEISAGDAVNRITAFDETVGPGGEIERGPMRSFRGAIRAGGGDDYVHAGNTGAEDWWEGTRRARAWQPSAWVRCVH